MFYSLTNRRGVPLWAPLVTLKEVLNETKGTHGGVGVPLYVKEVLDETKGTHGGVGVPLYAKRSP